jgi:phosphohistidine phosphatase
MEITMRLYLAQHGVALDKSEDMQRPLSAQGKEDIVRAGGFLSLFERPKPVRIVHSDKLRAAQTAHMFAEAWGCSCVEASDHLSPHDHVEVWASRLIEIHEDLMLVGHLPHLSRLVGLLLCGDINREVVHFQNGGVLCLERIENTWHVCWHVNPALFYPAD